MVACSNCNGVSAVGVAMEAQPRYGVGCASITGGWVDSALSCIFSLSLVKHFRTAGAGVGRSAWAYTLPLRFGTRGVMCACGCRGECPHAIAVMVVVWLGFSLSIPQPGFSHVRSFHCVVSCCNGGSWGDGWVIAQPTSR